MRLYLDEDLSPQVAVALRERGFDAISSHEVGNDGSPDEAQLRCAAQEARHLVSYNRRDYLALADLWYREGRGFPKILLLTENCCPRGDIGAQARLLEEYLSSMRADLNVADCVEYL